MEEGDDLKGVLDGAERFLCQTEPLVLCQGSLLPPSALSGLLMRPCVRLSGGHRSFWARPCLPRSLTCSGTAWLCCLGQIGSRTDRAHGPGLL